METKNIKLHLTDDSSERFKDWREKMNGVDNSNMVKIDNALGEKAERSGSCDKVLLSSAWTAGATSFTQELIIDGLTEEQNGMISVSGKASENQHNAARNAMLFVTNQENDKLVIAAYGECPTIDIPVTIILLY